MKIDKTSFALQRTEGLPPAYNRAVVYNRIVLLSFANCPVLRDGGRPPGLSQTTIGRMKRSLKLMKKSASYLAAQCSSMQCGKYFQRYQGKNKVFFINIVVVLFLPLQTHT